MASNRLAGTADPDYHGAMDFERFKQTLEDAEPPVEAAPLLRALWLVAKDDWHGAHVIAQGEHGEDGSWVHAHLHRVEGDLANAGYWYRRAGKPAATVSLDDEWDQIVAALLPGTAGPTAAK